MNVPDVHFQNYKWAATHLEFSLMGICGDLRDLLAFL